MNNSAHISQVSSTQAFHFIEDIRYLFLDNLGQSLTARTMDTPWLTSLYKTLNIIIVIGAPSDLPNKAMKHLPMF
jgi:hypothetical protein